MNLISIQNKVDRVLIKIQNAQKFLIIASKPVDSDSIGTALSIKWWLDKLNKESQIVVFAQIPQDVKSFPDIDLIKQTYLDKVDFNSYDYIVLVDGNSWKQFFTNNYVQILNSIDKLKLINIDHHMSGEIEKEIGDQVLRVEDCCTSKVFYDLFLKNRIDIDVRVAEYMFLALVGDTGNFKHAMYSDTFLFAQTLVNTGINIQKVLYRPVSKSTSDFTFWMYQNCEFYPEIECMLLKIDTKKREELDKLFGDGWDFNNFDYFFKLYFAANIEGFFYFVKFSEEQDKSEKVFTRISWRRSNYGAKVNLMDIFSICNFECGGHLNAGGGISKYSVEETSRMFLEEMYKFYK